MKIGCRNAFATVLVCVVIDVAAQPAAAVPEFDVAYRAWDVVTDIARYHRDSAVSGQCGKTFQPYVVPALRRQTKEEQAHAAVACLQLARALCADRTVARTRDIASKCMEFR